MMVGVLFDTPTPTHHLAWEFSFPPRILLPLITSHKNANQHKNKKAIYQQRAILGNAAIWYTPSSKYLQCVVWCVVLFFRDMAWRYLSRTGTIWIFCREPWVCGDLNSMSSTSHLIIHLSRSLALYFSFHGYKRDEFHKGKMAVPETRTEEGSARRNIARKHDHDPSR